MFLFTQPDISRNILEYRYVTLDGARAKARRLGYKGAFYAWTSGATGEELFPDFFFTDVLTGRKVRNHFNDWQIHISPDIVYAIWRYYQATDDWDFIITYGAEIVFEVARFLFSHAYFKKEKNRYEFVRLLGPDEYHENVDNNAFTNYQAHFALDKAVTIFKLMKESVPEQLSEMCARLDLNEGDAADWQEMVALLYLPKPNTESLVIEQFDGFFELEDISPNDLRKRLIDPDEYWGWPNGIAVHAQVLKQADVLQLLAIHDIFPREVNRANYDYYEPRTEHGSSLSPSMHSIVASKAGDTEDAYRYFMEAATIDLYNMSKKVVSGGSFLGGIHTAACGAVWQTIVNGFAGFRVNGRQLVFQPALPKNWNSVTFRLTFRANQFTFKLMKSQFEIQGHANNAEKVAIKVNEQLKNVEPGEKVTFRLRQESSRTITECCVNN
jgi:kojibiose phosphorylase